MVTVSSLCKGKDMFMLGQQCTHHNQSMLLLWQRYIHTTLYKTTLHLLYICLVLHMPTVCLQQILIASISRPTIQYKYFTEFLPTDLEVPSTSPTRGEIFSTVNGIPLHTAFHYHPSIVLISPTHHPDMTEIMFKRT